MLNLGDFREDDVIDFHWHTNNKSGASINPTTAGELRVYKNNSLIQTTVGITDNRAFDGLVGVHHCRILMSDAFYIANEEYSVVLQGATIDGEVVNATIAKFSVEKRAADIRRINGGRTDGYNAVLKIKHLDIRNTEGKAITAYAGTEGSSSYAGVDIRGINDGNGVEIRSGSGVNTFGLFIEGQLVGTFTTGVGSNSRGLHSTGSQWGALIESYLQGVGIEARGGPDGGNAMSLLTQYNGDGVESHGLQIIGRFAGIETSGAKESGIQAIGFQSGVRANGTDIGSPDIDAKEIGDIFDIDGVTGAGILDILKKFADDNGGADFDATNSSLHTILNAYDSGNGVAKQSSVESIQNNTRSVISLPNRFNIPKIGFIPYKVILNFYDTDGNMEDPDSDIFNIKLENQSAADLNGILYKDVACTIPLDAGSSLGYKKMERVPDNGEDGTGRYFMYVKVDDTADEQQLMYTFFCLENTIGLYYTRSNLIGFIETGEVTLEDSDPNKLVIVKAVKQYVASGVTPSAGSIYDDVITKIDEVPEDLLSEELDGDSIAQIFKFIRSMSKGRIVKETLGDGDYHTFYLPNATTPLFRIRITETERTEVSI